MSDYHYERLNAHQREIDLQYAAEDEAVCRAEEALAELAAAWDEAGMDDECRDGQYEWLAEQSGLSGYSLRRLCEMFGVKNF